MTKRRGTHLVLWTMAIVFFLAVVVLLWNAGKSILAGEGTGLSAYAVTTLLIIGDAVFPVLPGETTLNAATILAVNGELNIWLVIICGAVGAIVGDSALYWLARRSTGWIRVRLDQAGASKTGQQVVEQLRVRGPIFLIFGRYIPGVRFGLNVALGGVVRMPYRTFLFWSSISGTLWSLFTCACAYFVGTALAGYPLMSLVVTMVLSAALIAGFIWLQSKWIAHRGGPAANRALPDQPTASG